jgi:hypothetical protein
MCRTSDGAASLPDPAAQLVSNLNEKGIAVKTLDDLQSLKGEAFERFREVDPTHGLRLIRT